MKSQEPDHSGYEEIKLKGIFEMIIMQMNNRCVKIRTNDLKIVSPFVFYVWFKSTLL